jgi:iron(III) transport system ATP-binding protein
MAVSVTIERLSKSFDGVRAVDDVSLAIEPGGLFFLLGPSGCGKTTLLRCIAGFCRPDRGVIRLGERDVTGIPPHQRNTGMVFQSYALWPHMSVRENVSFGLELRGRPRGEIRDRVNEALDLVRMRDRADRKPAELSGGQQQRVALARALVVRPQCLLLDEPLSNLDAKLRLEMRGEIRRICKQSGLTAIYVTHDQKEALSIADRIAILDAGRIQQVGRPRDVYQSPGNRFVAGFIGEANLLDGTVQSVSGGRAVVRTRIGSVTAPFAGELPQGTAVSLCVRPEIIRLGDPPAGCPNVFPGAVHHTVYLGELAQHLVTLADGVEWKAFEMNPRFVARDEEVVRTAVWLAPEDLAVLTG